MTAFKYYKSFLIVFFILIACLYPVNQSNTYSLFNLPHFDKFVHFIMYSFLSFFFSLDLKKNTNKTDKVKIVFVLTILFLLGLCIEFIQEKLIIGRYASLGDIFANLTGSFFGVFIFYKLYKRKT